MITSLLMIFFGFSVINRFFKEGVLEKLALSFLTGFGILTTLLFLLIYFQIRLNHQIISSVLIALGLLSLILSLKPKQKEKIRKANFIFFKHLSSLQWFFLGSILISVLTSLVINWYWPVTAWDAMTLYDFRARLFASGGLLIDLWDNIGHDPEVLSYYYSYPPITSLAHAIGYMIGDTRTSLFYSFFYVSLITLFYSFVVKKSSVSVGLVLTFLLATNFTIFSHSLLAYTNVPQTTYIVVAFFILEKFAESKKLKYFLLGTTFAIMAILIRASDFFPFLILIILLPLVAEKRGYIKYTIFFIVALLSVRSFALTHFSADLARLSVKANEIQSSLTPSSALKALFDFNKYPKVFSYIYSSLSKYHLHILFFIISLFLFSKPKNASSRIVSVFIILSLLALVPGTLILSVTYVGWDKVPDSVHRLMFFLYPMILYYLAGVPEVKTFFDSFSVKMEAQK